MTVAVEYVDFLFPERGDGILCTASFRSTRLRGRAEPQRSRMVEAAVGEAKCGTAGRFVLGILVGIFDLRLWSSVGLGITPDQVLAEVPEYL
jgi:hypothetical protein